MYPHFMNVDIKIKYYYVIRIITIMISGMKLQRKTIKI